MTTSRALRCSAVAFGAALLLAAGTATASAEENLGDQDVEVSVDIQAIDEPGVLALTVASGSTALSESGSTDLVRQFTGTLPTVTVTDTRTPDEVPEGAMWSVLGTASDFLDVAQASRITADHLGWTPLLIEGEGEGETFISVGGPVGSAIDGGSGLVHEELLYFGDSQEAAAVAGRWSATAELQLRVRADVEPGSYTSILTLSLFE